SESPNTGAQHLYIWFANSLRSLKLSIGSRYVIPFSLKTSPSFVNAAFTVFGHAVTVGQAFEPCKFTNGVCRTSTMGKKITSNCLRNPLMKIRLYTCAMPIFAGKHGSIAPRLEPARYSSGLV